MAGIEGKIWCKVLRNFFGKGTNPSSSKADVHFSRTARGILSGLTICLEKCDIVLLISLNRARRQTQKPQNIKKCTAHLSTPFALRRYRSVLLLLFEARNEQKPRPSLSPLFAPLKQEKCLKGMRRLRFSSRACCGRGDLWRVGGQLRLIGGLPCACVLCQFAHVCQDSCAMMLFPVIENRVFDDFEMLVHALNKLFHIGSVLSVIT